MKKITNLLLVLAILGSSVSSGTLSAMDRPAQEAQPGRIAKFFNGCNEARATAWDKTKDAYQATKTFVQNPNVRKNAETFARGTAILGLYSYFAFNTFKQVRSNPFNKKSAAMVAAAGLLGAGVARHSFKKILPIGKEAAISTLGGIKTAAKATWNGTKYISNKLWNHKKKIAFTLAGIWAGKKAFRILAPIAGRYALSKAGNVLKTLAENPDYRTILENSGISIK